MIRSLDGRITVWGEGAQRLYGFNAGEALGKVSHELLRTQFPEPRADIETALLHNARWSGDQSIADATASGSS